MALPAPTLNNTKRVKVYELKNNDWYDRGTGFCSGTVLSAPSSSSDTIDAHIVVVSEEDTNRTLLETRITKDDGYQKQQETLIVWTESNGVDMALSFQEPEGCALVWEFVNDVQTRLTALAPDDGLSDDLLDSGHLVALTDPQLGRLDEIETAIRSASSTAPGRDALIKFIMSPEHMYITKLTPLVEAAEQLQSLGDLHKLCLIMKHLILLNDTSIIEFVVTDQAIMGVVGALEYDPDFPSHRANHRQYLSDSSKFKEVVKIDSPEVRRKIHYTYRLLYLKDVVLARFLDDPTFSVLNSLIFFHQVDIVNYLQSSIEFLQELFAIVKEDSTADALRKKEAVLFIQNCCAISKSIQAQSRAQLYINFIQHGLFDVIIFALRHRDAALRVAGTDILVALIDHDPHMVRNHIFTAVKDSRKPLTDTLIELLLIEVDLGVKSQMADAIKILLDPNANQPMDMASRAQNGEFLGKGRSGPHPMAPQTEAFIASFYEESALKLFQPLKALQNRDTMTNMSVQEISLYTHLVEVLSFFLRSHSYKSKLFILNEGLHARVAQLLACPQKHMKLTALKWFRSCIGLKDEFHNRAIMTQNLFQPILEILYKTMPRDNLLNSACLEMFEFISREKDRQLKGYLVENYGPDFMTIDYVDTFRNLVDKYNVNEEDEVHEESIATEDMPPRTINGSQYTGLRDDLDEEAYFDGDDDVAGVDDDELALPVEKVNGNHAVRPLVDYPDDDDDDVVDDEDEAADLLASSPDVHSHKRVHLAENSIIQSSPPTVLERGRDRNPVPVEGSPGRQTPEPSPMKRRREDDEEDELGKLMGGQVKRRNSSASMHSHMASASLQDNMPEEHGINGGSHPPQHVYAQHGHDEQHDSSPPAVESPLTHTLRRTKSMKTRNEGPLNGEQAIDHHLHSTAVDAVAHDNGTNAD